MFGPIEMHEHQLEPLVMIESINQIRLNQKIKLARAELTEVHCITVNSCKLFYCLDTSNGIVNA